MMLALLLLLTGSGSATETTYPMVGRVVEVNYITNTVTIESHNNLWDFYGTEDWELGDIAACIMSDNGTQTIYDDKILLATYQGDLGVD